jgi:hypothetical protein
MAPPALFLRLSIVLVVPAALALPAWGRTWTQRDGKTIEGDFVRLDGEQVVLVVGGKETRVPLASLSDGDQAYAKLFNPASEPAGPTANPFGGGASSPNDSPAIQPTAPTDPSIPDLSKSRKWTDRAGKSASGTLHSVSGGKVYLKIGSRLQTVAFEQLIDADQEAVRKYLEYLGQGLQVPPGAKDLPEQSLRTFRDKNDRSVLAVLRRVEPGGTVVLQLGTRTATFPLGNFSPADQEHIREQVTALGDPGVLPPDETLRTWRDWRGRTFTARLDPAISLKSMGSTVHFKLSTGARKSLPFVALSEADRDYLEALVAAAGGTLLQARFAEPDTEIRFWSLNDGATSVEGKFVRVSGTNAVLRTEADASRPVPLAALGAADRRYIESVLASRGEPTEVPIVAADCRKWAYGPAGRGNSLTAKFGDAAEGYVKLLLPAEHRVTGDRGFVVVPFLCLSEDDQKHVKGEWTGDPSALVPVEDAVVHDIRDWSLDEDRRAIRGKLQYVTHDSVTISEGGVPRKVAFSSLSAEDMDYVQRLVALMGMARFDPPGAAAGLVFEGVAKEQSAPEAAAPAPASIGLLKSEAMSAWEVTKAIFCSLAFVLLLVVIAAVLMKVLT